MVGDTQSDVVNIGWAFINGIKVDNYYKNTSACFDRITNWTYIDLPPYVTKMNDATRDTFTKITDTANITQVASNDLWVCNDFLKNFIVY